MASDAATPAPAPPADDDLGIDRAFVLQMAQVPVIAAGFTLLAYLGHAVWNEAAVALLIAGMILAAVIDGWKFKVPNWLTLSMIVAGWMIGALHGLEVPIGPGPVYGGGLSAFIGSAFAFALLYPMLFIGGMGEGDVKMQTGFGAWVGALYGYHAGLYVIGIAVVLGYLAGGVIGGVMMLLRGKFGENKQNAAEILKDFQVMFTAGPKAASQRARGRRPTWHRLPYGIPLCIGFVVTLLFRERLLDWVLG